MKGLRVLLQLVVAEVVIAPDGGFLQRSVHSLDLAIRPEMVRLDEAVLRTMLAVCRSIIACKA
jgi:hypothetical protein